jgi:ubiquinone biosynthesis protein COQ9
MKTATKTPIRSSDELWLWAEEKRHSSLASKYAKPRVSARHTSPMAQGILSRLYSLLKSSGLTLR